MAPRPPPMNLNPLTALSPLDRRYPAKHPPLRAAPRATLPARSPRQPP